MPWSLLWYEAAEADLDAIWVYIAQEDETAADRQIECIIEAVDFLGAFPRLGPDRSDIDTGLRGLKRDDYLILYDILEEQRQVRILRVIHGRRDIALLFHQGE
jgi:toxin ParE1/3/4